MQGLLPPIFRNVVEHWWQNDSLSASLSWPDFLWTLASSNSWLLHLNSKALRRGPASKTGQRQ